jgi:uncharacterized membrane protein HdeD (DUF308 family)
VSSVSEKAGQSAATPTSQPAGKSPGRVAAAAVLGIIGILLIVATIIYFTEPAKSLPGILGHIKYNGHNLKRVNEKRPLHGIATLIVGVVFFVLAYFAYAWKTTTKSS